MALIDDIYREFNVPVLVASENGPTSAEMAMAREIERLRARVAQLEKALEDVAEYCCDADPTFSTAEYIARRGLREIK